MKMRIKFLFLINILTSQYSVFLVWPEGIRAGEAGQNFILKPFIRNGIQKERNERGSGFVHSLLLLSVWHWFLVLFTLFHLIVNYTSETDRITLIFQNYKSQCSEKETRLTSRWWNPGMWQSRGWTLTLSALSRPSFSVLNSGNISNSFYSSTWTVFLKLSSSEETQICQHGPGGSSAAVVNTGLVGRGYLAARPSHSLPEPQWGSAAKLRQETPGRWMRESVSPPTQSPPEMPAASVPGRVITKRHDPGEKILMEKRKLFWIFCLFVSKHWWAHARGIWFLFSSLFIWQQLSSPNT